MQNTLEVKLKSSAKLKIWFLSGIFLLGSLCVLADASPVIRSIALLYLLLIAYWIFREWIQLDAPQSITAIRYDGYSWWLEVVNGECWEVMLRESASVMTARIIALEFAAKESQSRGRLGTLWRSCRGKTFHALILEDSASAQQRRELRLRLRAASC